MNDEGLVAVLCAAPLIIATPVILFALVMHWLGFGEHMSDRRSVVVAKEPLE